MAAPKAGTSTSARHLIQQPEQAEQQAVASGRDSFLGAIIHAEPNTI